MAGDVRGVPLFGWWQIVVESGGVGYVGLVGSWTGGQVVRVLVLGEIGVIARAGRLSV